MVTAGEFRLEDFKDGKQSAAKNRSQAALWLWQVLIVYWEKNQYPTNSPALGCRFKTISTVGTFGFINLKCGKRESQTFYKASIFLR